MRRGVCGVVVGLMLAAGPGRADDAKTAEDERAAFFRDGKVVTLAVDVGPKEADSLRREPKKYVTATLKEGTKTYPNVGVHLRGAVGSFRPFDDRPGLTINMDKFADDQRFHGLDKFHLANSVQDPSYLSELICGELFRAAGVPAARIGHAVVTVNGRPRGLYYLKEGYDAGFLRLHFKNSHGNLYDGGFLVDIDTPLQLLSGKGDVADRADLKALAAAAREPDPAKRYARLEKLLDLDAFISYLAVDTVIWDWDGYPVKRNNYRVYHDPARDKIVFIPSGMDQMFADVNGPILPGFEGMVARGLIDTPEGKKRYLARVSEVMKTVFRTDALLKRLDELEARIQPVLAKIDAGAGRDYKNHVDRLRHAVRERPKSVNEQLKRPMVP
ncbi:MAG: CotH kinase family protein [Gemmataceae bacterium]|nr:CotH kinase family protein [Gemmataceae bacterium]